jgi:Uma2 family endonuclease
VIKTPDVRGGDALLVVEVADSSLRFDLKTKAPVYAAHGVREYWIINAATLATILHKEPSGGAYESVRKISPGAVLALALVPPLAVSLGALGID